MILNVNNPQGYIKLILGCMFSGKTDELIKEYHRWNRIKKVLVINYAKDNRYTEELFLYSHNLTKIPCIKVLKLEEIETNTIENYDIILINEGQFFIDLLENVIKWVEILKKNVYVAGLDGDCRRENFNPIIDLLPKADDIVKLKAKCHLCKNGNDAIFTWRLTKETVVEVIGTDNYISVCREHYIELKSSN